MNAEPKNCGTCEWSGPLPKGDGHSTPTGKARLDCGWLYRSGVRLPACLYVTQTFVYWDDGHCCPQWKEKEVKT